MKYSTHHSFDVNLATEYGIEEAILIHHFQHWISINKRMGKNNIEGRTWSYQTQEWITAHFPYWKNRKKLERLIRSLTDKKILIKENFNKSSYNRTSWYAFTDEEKFLSNVSFDPTLVEKPVPQEKNSPSQRKDKSVQCIGQNCPMERTEVSNGLVESVQSIKDIDTKTDAKEIERRNSSSRLATFLFENIKKINPKAKKPNLEDWAKAIEKLMRLDSRTEQEIEAVIHWVTNNDFWCKNILSGKKLREKFDQLYISMIKHKESPQTREKAEAKQKADRIQANRDWAQNFLASKTFSHTSYLRLKENGVEAKINKGYQIIGFLEHGFKEQVMSLYRKIPGGGK